MKRYVMIGAPVTAVRTPPLLERFLGGLGVDCTVETRHLEPGELAGFMAAACCDPAVDGLLVTMPHKRAIIAHLHGISAVAARAGSVNAAKRLPDGAMVGAQFDGVALVEAVLAKGAPLASARVLLAGLGGAGLAVAQALMAHGCAALALAERDPVLLAAALAALPALGRTPVAAAADGPFDLLVNATPLGMRDGDPSPFDERTVAAAPWIADIVADPPATRLAAMARECGATLITGRDMVLGQVEPIGRWLLAPGVEQ